MYQIIVTYSCSTSYCNLSSIRKNKISERVFINCSHTLIMAIFPALTLALSKTHVSMQSSTLLLAFIKYVNKKFYQQLTKTYLSIVKLGKIEHKPGLTVKLSEHPLRACNLDLQNGNLHIKNFYLFQQ